MSRTVTNQIDEMDRRILDFAQSSFPICSRPYAEIGRELGMGEEEVFERIRRMRRDGLIRRMGANFQSSRLGFVSTLCAAKVPEELKEDFINLVNAIPGVTHNYERKHDYNIWFTLISEKPERSKAILAELAAKSGIAILDLPATRLFKIRVDFPMA